MATVFASTACLPETAPLLERIHVYHTHGIDAVELGAKVTLATPFRPEDLPLPGSYLLHNYFPPPEHPFILNLASADPALRLRSVEFVKGAVRTSAKLHAPVYSVHAGFVTDPTLSFAFTQKPKAGEAASALQRFVASLCEVLTVAEACGVQLLVENNVCLPHLRGQLLCQTPEEFVELFSLVSTARLGILLDTGHLNVSAKTFTFSPLHFLEKLENHIGALHLHGNDGNADQHQSVGEEGWIMDMLHRPAIACVPWIVEASFPDVSALSAHVRFLQQIAAGIPL
ncbi:MAG: sugar phosphate isomerase/epimerase [Candidatus Peribacteraceae bacterium]|nr:sugar phosphate isomerase/epimerase [Candidatus Peribacteraceae bacterium]